MMRTMRERSKWIMLAAALAFVALMVFEWGMDASGRSGGSAGTLGRVNGTPVAYEAYQNVYRNLLDQAQAAQSEPLTSQQSRDLEDRAWDEVVNQILIQEELGRRGIVVTVEELRQAAQFTPPPGFRSNPAFQTDGAFDLQKYQSFINESPDEVLLQLEAYYRDIIPRGKLLRQVTEGIYVPDGELWQAWKDQNEQARIRYLSLDPERRVADADVIVSDEEIQEYYDDHREEFAVPARASVNAVVVPKIVNQADSAAALQHAMDVREEILGGVDFAEVARRESADSISAAEGGALGTFGRGDMTPAFDSAVFATRVSQLTEPVRTGFGWHVIEVTERWADSATARHILIPIERTDESEFALLGMADSLEALTEDRPLEEAARILGLEVQSAEITEDFPLLAVAGRVGEGADWAINEAEIGETSEVFETQQAFYALEVLNTEPAGYLPVDQARTAIEASLRSEKKMELASERAEEVMASLGAGATLDQIAEGMELEVTEPEPFSRADFVPGLGRANAAVGAAFGLPLGARSDIVKTPTGAYILEVVERIPADSAAWSAQRETQRDQSQQLTAQQRLQEWLFGLRENARIVDRRDEVLRPADEEVPLPTGPFGI